MRQSVFLEPRCLQDGESGWRWLAETFLFLKTVKEVDRNMSPASLAGDVGTLWGK